MLIGTTYSHRHSQYLRLDPHKSFAELLDFGFDIIRLACYWEEIEKEQGKYDFSAIQHLLDRCEKIGQHVLLTVGMKAPRWPEYYFPPWLPEKTPESAAPFAFAFVERAIETLQEYSCITHWQIENEPLDPSGPRDLVVPRTFLDQEIHIVRKKDRRPIVVNLWGNELLKRQLLPIAAKLADVIGLDLYYKVPLFGSFYRGPNESDEELAKSMKQAKRSFWITELQAEPWEHAIFAQRQGNTPSMNEQLLIKNFKRALALKPAASFFWGFEYWLMRRDKGDPSLWNAAKSIVAENKEQVANNNN